MLLIAAAAAGILVSSVAAGRAATIRIACGAVGIEYQLCRQGAEAWAGQAGQQVELVQSPALANNRLAMMQLMLAAGSSDIDVLQVDVVWPGTLGRFFLDLGRYFTAEEITAHFPVLIRNNTVAGKLRAMPWFADVGMLYYRKDLLERYHIAVPTRWSDLASAARTIVAAERRNGERDLVGFVFQAKAYEGLTCDALEWIASFGGGDIVDPDGNVTLDNPAAVAALRTAHSWIGDIAPRGVLNYAEEEARGMFQSGRAVFMRNWPYAWALANAPDSPIRGKVGLAPLPAGANGRSVAVLGGSGLAVSRFSRHPAAAADLVRYLTSAAEQKRRAIRGAFNPTRPTLYHDADIERAQPHLRLLLDILEHAVIRPSHIAGPDYNQLSNIFWNGVHDALAGRVTPAAALAATQQRLERLARRGGW